MYITIYMCCNSHLCWVQVIISLQTWTYYIIGTNKLLLGIIILVAYIMCYITIATSFSALQILSVLFASFLIVFLLCLVEFVIHAFLFSFLWLCLLFWLHLFLWLWLLFWLCLFLWLCCILYCLTFSLTLYCCCCCCCWMCIFS